MNSTETTATQPQPRIATQGRLHTAGYRWLDLNATTRVCMRLGQLVAVATKSADQRHARELALRLTRAPLRFGEWRSPAQSPALPLIEASRGLLDWRGVWSVATIDEYRTARDVAA
jgi:hypothetical protein